ncbi:MAG: Gfo/Idh/MocA family oxidoreductase [Ignavibacteria bacterium]|nr:Gfo/Idh/MocA family oxidoreductase [Ignavibacteria bacterium]
MKKIRIGIVGMGFIAGWHYNGFAVQEDAEIVGMCQDFHGTSEQISEKKKQLEKSCADFGIKPYNDFDEMVNDPNIDALIIGSINPYHYDQIIAGLNAGKHLLVEKPVVTDLNQIDPIIKLAKEKDKIVFPAHNFAYRGAVKKAKEVLESGVLGKIIHSSFVISHTLIPAHQTGWRAKKELGTGGTLIDSGHHIIYQCLYLLGMPVAIHGFTSKLVLTNMDCEDTAQVNMQYADGSLCFLMQSWASGNADGVNGFRILGEKGNLVITDALYVNGEKISDDVEYGNSFVNQARAFLDSVKTGIEPISTLEDVRNTLKIVFSTYESAEKNIVIRF